MLLGMQPPSLLFAKTTTETGELPRLSGMLELNRLSFKNSASRSLSNSLEGRDPSKSLNRRSRYFNEGMLRTTMGKGPTNLLLLKSNS